MPLKHELDDDTKDFSLMPPITPMRDEPEEEVPEPIVMEAVDPDPMPQPPLGSQGDADHSRFVREDMLYKQQIHEWQSRRK